MRANTSRMGAGGRGVQGGAVMDTGLRPVWSKKSSTALFVPLTEGLDTTRIKEVRMAFQLAGITSKFQGRVAYRMSDDGIVWSATVTGLDTVRTADGWYYSDGSAAAITTDQKLFVQFGMEVSNVSGVQVEQGLAQIMVQPRDLKGRSVYASMEKVWTDGTTSNMFNPLTEGILVEQIGELRATLELVSNSDNGATNLDVQPAYQVSNDGRSWYNGVTGGAAGSAALFGTLRAGGNGIDYGTTFATFNPDEKKKWVRFGVAAKNGTAGKSEAGLVNLRVDVRRS